MIILWITRGKAWNHDKTYGEDDEEAPEQSHPSGAVRLSFGTRPTRLVGEFGVDDVHPDTSRNASWSTVVGGSGAGHRDDDDDDVNVTELRLCSSQPSSVIDDLKA